MLPEEDGDLRASGENVGKWGRDVSLRPPRGRTRGDAPTPFPPQGRRAGDSCVLRKSLLMILMQADLAWCPKRFDPDRCGRPLFLLQQVATQGLAG